VTSFLGRHGEKQGVLPAFGVIQTARASQLPVDPRSKVMAGFALPDAHGAIMRLRDMAGKVLCTAQSSGLVARLAAP
jgi:hypothetical protein